MGFLAERDTINIGFARLQLFEQRVLDRKAMTVPTRNLKAVKTLHGLVFYNKILKDLVERMADMDIAVSIRRAVMQDERRLAFGPGTDALIQSGLFPGC